MEKLNVLVIFIHLIIMYQCTSLSTLNGQVQNFYSNSVNSNTTSLLFELPKIIRNTSFDIAHISNETGQNNISVTMIEDNKKIPVSSDGNNTVDTRNVSLFRKLTTTASNEMGHEGNRNVVTLSDISNSKFILNTAAARKKFKNDLKLVANDISNSRTSKNTPINNGNLDITNSTLDEEELRDGISNKNQTEAREENDEFNTTPTETTEIIEIENFTTIYNLNEENDNIPNPTIIGVPDPPGYNVTQKSKTKIFNITANLEIILQNNLHKIVASVKTEKGKYLLPHLMDKFESTILRPIKDTLDTIHIELSPEYNNNYGSEIQPNTPLFLQKLHEKKNKILNHFGIRCCNYDYPYPY